MKFGLIRGRHDIPDVDGYIFDGDVSPVDVQGTFEDAYDFLKEYKGKKGRHICDGPYDGASFGHECGKVSRH